MTEAEASLLNELKRCVEISERIAKRHPDLAHVITRAGAIRREYEATRARLIPAPPANPLMDSTKRQSFEDVLERGALDVESADSMPEAWLPPDSLQMTIVAYRDEGEEDVQARICLLPFDVRRLHSLLGHWLERKDELKF